MSDTGVMVGQSFRTQRHHDRKWIPIRSTTLYSHIYYHIVCRFLLCHGWSNFAMFTTTSIAIIGARHAQDAWSSKGSLECRCAYKLITYRRSRARPALLVSDCMRGRERIGPTDRDLVFGIGSDDLGNSSPVLILWTTELEKHLTKSPRPRESQAGEIRKPFRPLR